MHILLYRVHQLAARMAVYRAQLSVETLEFNLSCQVSAVFVQQQADGRWRQETGELQLFRRLRFHNVNQLQQQRSHRQRLVF